MADPDPPVGSSVQEAARLLVALVDRAKESLGGEPGEGGHLGAISDLGGDIGADAGQAAACSWCPLCQAIAFVRATNPEVREQVATAAAALALALRDLAESAAASPQPPDPHSGPHSNDGDDDGDDPGPAAETTRKDDGWD
jgi:hypothetical protein